ncbi:MAG: integrase [Candidatus Aldehydirespiratoraceae bacterium]
MELGERVGGVLKPSAGGGQVGLGPFASFDGPGVVTGQLGAVGTENTFIRRRRGHGEGGIYQRKRDGMWVGTVELGWHDGKRKRKTVTAKTRKLVTARLREAQKRVDEGMVVLDDRRLLADFLDTWLKEVVKPSVRPRTYGSYETVVRIHLAPTLGHLRLNQLRPQHVQRLLADKTTTGLSARTVEYIWSILRRALKVAVQWDLVARNVADQVTPPRPVHKEIIPLSIPEIQLVLGEATTSMRYGAAVTLALTTGMRRGEILGLQWDDIDFTDDSARLRVRRTLQRIDGQLQCGEPKSSKSRRTITLTSLATKALQRQRVAQAQERLAAGELWASEGYVFATPLGHPVDPRNFHRSWHSLLDRVGLDRRPLHETRHSAASVMLSSGVPLKTVQETLGHSSIQLTADLYGHVMPGDADRVADAVDKALRA